MKQAHVVGGSGRASLIVRMSENGKSGAAGKGMGTRGDHSIFHRMGFLDQSAWAPDRRPVLCRARGLGAAAASARAAAAWPRRSVGFQTGLSAGLGGP